MYIDLYSFPINKDTYNLFYVEDILQENLPKDDRTYKRLNLSNNPDLSFTLENNKGDIFLLTKAITLDNKSNFLMLNLFNVEGSAFFPKTLDDSYKEYVKEINKDKYLCIPFYKTSENKNETRLNLYKFPSIRKINKEPIYCIEINEDYKKYKGLYSANVIFADNMLYRKDSENALYTRVGRALSKTFNTLNVDNGKFYIGYEDYFNYPSPRNYEESDVIGILGWDNEEDKEFVEEFNDNDKITYFYSKIISCIEPIYVVDINNLKEHFNDENFDIEDTNQNIIDMNNAIEIINLNKQEVKDYY